MQSKQARREAHKCRTWVDGQGNDWQIRQMSSEHIYNCIKRIHYMVAYGRPWRLRYLRPLARELSRRQAPQGFRARCRVLTVEGRFGGPNRS